MKYLIVNADDFGYSYSVNQGIIEAHVHGIVTSTSVMVDAIAAEEAADLNNYPDLSVGLHFVATEFTDVKAELERQVEKFVAIVGAEPDHINSHKIHPNDERLKDALQQYAKLHNIPLRRFCAAKFIDSFFGPHADGDVSVARLKKVIDEVSDEYNEIMCHVGYCDDYLLEHSSYNKKPEAELKTVCDPEIRQYITDKGIELCNWKQLV